MAKRQLPLTIPALLEETASLYPDHPAFVETRGSRRLTVTWAEVQTEAEHIAAGLIALGLGAGAGDRVAICAENSVEWLQAFYGVSLAGGTAVLVYYELRETELKHQIGYPGSRFLLASDAVISRATEIEGIEHTISLTPGSPTAMTLDALKATATDESRRKLQARAPAPDDLAAIIYTSGTTGGAKGVMLSHRNFMSNGAAAYQSLCISHEDSVMLVLPLHHAMPFIATTVLASIVGATVYIENDLRRVRDRLQEYRPTIFFGVPALYEIVYRNIHARAEAEGRAGMLRRAIQVSKAVKSRTGINLGPLLFRTVHKALGGKLRFLVSGGAALDPELARDYFALGLPLLQGWGMTEASPVIAVQRFSSLKFRFTRHYERLAGSVGQALAGVEVRLIDVPEKDVRVATSGEGEVIVRGTNVFRGYWDAPDATANAMLDGWLRTGDMARIDKDGNIFLTGRSKYVIVLNSGEKVHPDELEAVYSRSELLTDLAIVERQVRDKVVVAAFVYPAVEAARSALSDGVVTVEAVRSLVLAEIDRLGRGLAAYKRVTQIELSDEPLPKTVLRKVARGQIKESYNFDLERWLASSETGS